MTGLSTEFKKKIAGIYLENEKGLENIDIDTLELFALRVLNVIHEESVDVALVHDLKVLEETMNHLRNDLVHLRNSKPGTDDYDFARNDCKNTVKATKTWLTTEKLL
jgi:hypothetical protein